MNITILCPPEVQVPLEGRYGGIERICVDLLHELVFNSGSEKDGVMFCNPGPHASSVLQPYPRDLSRLDVGQDLTLDFTHTKVGANFFTKKNYIAMNVLTDVESDVNDVYQSRAVAEGFGKPNGEVIYAGINPDHYKYSAEKDDYLLFLGRMSKIKRPDIAIAVAQAVGKRIVLAGLFKGIMAEYPDPAFPASIKAYAKDYPREIEIVEEPTDEDKADLLTHASALIMPSQWSLIGSKESFGLAAVEALMSGTPVICSGEGGLSEIVTPDVGACCTGNFGEYVDAVKRLDEFRPIKCHERGMKFTSARMLADFLEHWRESQ